MAHGDHFIVMPSSREISTRNGIGGLPELADLSMTRRTLDHQGEYSNFSIASPPMTSGFVGIEASRFGVRGRSLSKNKQKQPGKGKKRERKKKEKRIPGVPLDTGNDGLDLDKAEVIELAMLKFEYSPDGEVLRVIDRFSELRQPSPIPFRWRSRLLDRHHR